MKTFNRDYFSKSVFEVGFTGPWNRRMNSGINILGSPMRDVTMTYKVSVDVFGESSVQICTLGSPMFSSETILEFIGKRDMRKQIWEVLRSEV
jgi:hypothetical protein